MEALSLSRLDSLLILCSVVTSLSHLWILIVDLTTRDSAAGIGLATNRTALWLGFAYSLGTSIWITYFTSRKTYFPRWDSGNSHHPPMHDQSNTTGYEKAHYLAWLLICTAATLTLELDLLWALAKALRAFWALSRVDPSLTTLSTLVSTTVFLYCAIPTLLAFGGAAVLPLLPHGRLVSYGREAKDESVGKLVRLPEDPGNKKKAD